ncbi:uncharacterized protein LOC123906813 isoform X3 [Trifolium pratense]|uniref:uncharacterized protein LOC123906813 isoform X3 n=1 Tax=Trifolium pratense TaxID=57577 RepID=UPI001E6911C9|nr:uncharacterized protein LOC123906813 isoform X3 [Trifolium pratense]
MATRGRRTKRARGRGRSDPPQPSNSLGVKVDNEEIQKEGPAKGFDALNNKQKSAPFNSEQNDEDNNYNDDEEMQLIMDEIYQRQLVKKQAADANNAKNCIEASFGLPSNVRPSSGGSPAETDWQKLISLEGIFSSGRRITRSQGRGCSNPPGPSQLCIDPPPQPVHTLVSPGVKNDKKRIQKKRQGKGADTLNNKQKSTAFNSEQNVEHCDNNGAEDEELQLIIDKICHSQLHKQQATVANNVEKYIGSNFGLSNNARSSSVGYHVETDTRKVISVEDISNPGRRITRGRGRGRSDPPGPSQSCIVPPPQPAHTTVIPGVKSDKSRIQKKGRGKGVDTLNNKRKSSAFDSEQNDEYYDNNAGVDEELGLVTEKSIQPQLHRKQTTDANNVEKYIGSNFGLSPNVRSSSVGYHVETDTRKVISVEGISNPGRGIKRGQRRGCSDPPRPSQSCTVPPLTTILVAPGVHNDNNRVQRKGLVKGFSALNSKQKATAVYPEHNDEYNDYSNDEEMQLIMEKIYQRQLLKQQAAIANNVKKCIGDSFGLSHDVRPSSGGSHIEADRRNVVSVEGISNLGRGIKHGRGRGRSDPPGPSQSCIDPPATARTSVSPGAAADNGHATVYDRGDTSAAMGMKNDKNKMQSKGLVKGLDALNNTQQFAAVSSGENDKYSDYNDGEDEEMQLIGEKSIEQPLRHQVDDTNNVKQCNRGDSGVSNHGSMDSASSDSVSNSTDYSPANDPTSLPLSGRSRVGIDRRKVISIEDNSNPRRFVPQSVTRDIISTVIGQMPIPAAKWKAYPIEKKDELFKEFMGKYKFASDSECNIARMVWERTCMDRYPDHLKNARKTALRRVNSTNLADTKGHGPKGLKPEIWNGLVDIWLKPEWTKMSDANRCNRASKPDSALHTGGSISFREHKKRMEEEIKQEVSYRDVYDHVHKRKDGGYISRRSKKLIELYDTIMLEKYGEDMSMHPEFDSEVWAEVSGMNKKRRTYGYEGRNLDTGTFGPMSTSDPEAAGPSRTHTVAPRTHTAAPTEEYIKEAVNTAMTSFMQTQLAPMLQPILSMIGSSMREALSQGKVAEKDGEAER